MSAAATAVESSTNRKLGAASATYVSQASCPASCPWYGSGCYAENGPIGYTTRRLNRSPERRAERIARDEARAVDGLSGSRPLRLHVVGDARTKAAARILARAAQRFRARGGQPVWSYTHAWRTVDRASWGPVSVLASCETPADAREAMAAGYAAALVVEHHASDKAHDVGGVRVIPCPNQTRGVTCTDCGLCMDDGRLRSRGLAIAFAAHGRSIKPALRQTLASLPVV
jgi:hypothetical protein